MADRSALGAFLRSRRDRLTPAQAGIRPFPGARRVPGLRKEELAVLAGLSPDHYSRLEQGRQSTLTDEVLTAQRTRHLERMRELTRRKSSGDLADKLICDHAIFHLEADLRWLELTAARLDELAEALR